MSRVDKLVWPLLVRAVADKRYSKHDGDGLFQSMLNERNDTVIEQNVYDNGKVQTMLASPQLTGNVCEKCGRPVFGWSSLCNACAKEASDGVRE